MSAHAVIKAAILAGGRFGDHTVEVYLQGSYRNHVNTRQESDVDIIAELTSVAAYDTSSLYPWEQALFWSTFQYSEYDYQHFRADVHASLTSRFRESVVPHAKALEVRGNWLRLKVDVLPAIRYRQVYAFDGVNMSSNDGIAFWTADGQRLVNWPHQHFDSGVAKNERCGGNYKPSVRMFKNARRAAIDRGLVTSDLAPSYFLQGLLWNVPDDLFGADHSKTYCDVVNWLIQNRWIQHQFRCQNGVDLLFGTSPGQWDLNPASATEDALVALWNSWQ